MTAPAGTRRTPPEETRRKRAIEEHEVVTLGARDSRVFVEALLNPKPVNDRLRATVRRYREMTGAEVR